MRISDWSSDVCSSDLTRQATIAQADLRLNVIRAYAEAPSAERRLITARAQARIANETLRAAQVRVQAGRASPIAAERAHVPRVNADAALTRTERAVEGARFTLPRIIGQPIAATLDTDHRGTEQSTDTACPSG